ncbi:MAG: GDP-mannose 4,6-dehydratase [Alphaproteobacteria bacterium]|nr:MAG: GDP-mannose 4,6-dehydratase [Alphaproteobacteria bacterium]
MPKALVTGIGGQDGAYLAKLLLDKGYTVYGGLRRSSQGDPWRLQELGIEQKVKLVPFELLEMSNLLSLIREIQPDEIFNLAAQSFVATSFKQPLFTADSDAMGVLRLLEAVRMAKPDARVYQASTSEMFGKVQAMPQCETTPFYPRSPYGVAKLFGHWMVVNYRESYDMHASSGILFNHESPLRGEEFVTRKITVILAQLAHGLRQDPLELGNLAAKRDWGHARDYVQGMWLMLQQDKADDYVLATGQMHSVEEFVNAAAPVAGFDLVWEGEGVNRLARDRSNGKVIVRVNPEFFRPAEVDVLCGDPSKAQKALGWKPATSFEKLVQDMAMRDMERAECRKTESAKLSARVAA